MTAARVVLVTGVGRYLGARLAARLADDPRVGKVIGVDGVPPAGDLVPALAGVHLRTVDPGTPEITRVMLDEGVEAVVHLAVSASPNPAAGGRSAMKELNVIGTIQVLAACQRAPTLAKLVVRSSTAAYGASFRDPAVFTEDTEPREVPRGGFARDVLDIEGYVRSFRRRRPEVAATVLRFAPLLGPAGGTRLARYFSLPLVPTVLGRDPRLQFLHPDDAFEVLRRAVLEDHPGTFNVAGAGVLTLSQAIRRAGRLPAPVVERAISTAVLLGRGTRAAELLGRGTRPAELLGRGTRAVPFTLDQLDLFVHGRVVDTSRLIAEFGFRPRSTAQTFAEFVRANCQDALLGPERVRAVEQLILHRLRQARQPVGPGARPNGEHDGPG